MFLTMYTIVITQAYKNEYFLNGYLSLILNTNLVKFVFILKSWIYTL